MNLNEKLTRTFLVFESYTYTTKSISASIHARKHISIHAILKNYVLIRNVFSQYLQLCACAAPTCKNVDLPASTGVLFSCRWKTAFNLFPFRRSGLERAGIVKPQSEYQRYANMVKLNSRIYTSTRTSMSVYWNAHVHVYIDCVSAKHRRVLNRKLRIDTVIPWTYSKVIKYMRCVVV